MPKMTDYVALWKKYQSGVLLKKYLLNAYV